MPGVALFRGPGHVMEWANAELLALAPARDPIGKPIVEVFPEGEFAEPIAAMDVCFRTGRIIKLDRPFGILVFVPRLKAGLIVGVGSWFRLDPARAAAPHPPTHLRLPARLDRQAVGGPR